MTCHIPPGVQNCNPFDLMYTPSITWLGQVTPQAKGTSLLRFYSAVDGIRAGMKDAHTKVYVHLYNTISKFIPVFAPAFQNDDAAYIANMSEWFGIGPHDRIDLSTPAAAVRWALACNRQEVGLDPTTGKPWFTDAQYEAAAMMAYGLAP